MHRWNPEDPWADQNPTQRPTQSPKLRISDADRDQAFARLGEHFAAGRLDKDEFDERSDAVWSAKTGADLAPVFADLEAPRAVPEGRRPRGGRALGGRALGGWHGRAWPVPFLPVLLLLVGLTVLTHLPFVLLAFVGWCLLAGRRRRHWSQMSGSRF